jgi:hypothetical protein
MVQATLSVRGKQHEWGVVAPMSRDQISAMREDGIDVGILQNVVPAWVNDAGLLRPWCFFQNLWNFNNPWRL